MIRENQTKDDKILNLHYWCTIKTYFPELKSELPIIIIIKIFTRKNTQNSSTCIDMSYLPFIPLFGTSHQTIWVGFFADM